MISGVVTEIYKKIYETAEKKRHASKAELRTHPISTIKITVNVTANSKSSVSECENRYRLTMSMWQFSS